MTYATTSSERRFYVTVRDPRRRTSKTVTIAGDGLTARRVIELVVAAVKQQRKAAG